MGLRKLGLKESERHADFRFKEHKDEQATTN
jgi:hypothetical protein